MLQAKSAAITAHASTLRALLPQTFTFRSSSETMEVDGGGVDGVCESFDRDGHVLMMCYYASTEVPRNQSRCESYEIA